MASQIATDLFEMLQAVGLVPKAPTTVIPPTVAEVATTVNDVAETYVPGLAALETRLGELEKAIFGSVDPNSTGGPKAAAAAKLAATPVVPSL